AGVAGTGGGEPRREDGRRVADTTQRAGDDQVRRHCPQPGQMGGDLPQPELGQRRVAAALQAPLDVPLGLTVADEDEFSGQTASLSA
ncbi:MAG TPA: hypothetical protein VLA56_01745, partial [Pseudomonadales bacterium]|nr:hypothetical protein [Pseudomonadales bacterium]